MRALHRAVLRCYPRWWREQHGEEALGLLLDSAESSGRTDPRDLLNLAAHAARVRFTQAGPPTLIQGIRNRVAVIAVVLLAMMSSTLLIFGEWAPWDPQTSMEPSRIGNVTTGSICFLACLLAAIAAATGRATAGRWLAAFGGVSALVIMVPPISQLAAGYGFTRPPGEVLGFLAVVCALAAVGEPRLPSSSGRLVILFGTLPTVGAVLISAWSLHTDSWFYYRAPDQVTLRFSAGVVLGIVLLAIAVAILLSGGSRRWAAALAVNSMPWLLLFYAGWFRHAITFRPVEGLILLAAIGVAILTGFIAVSSGRKLQSARKSVASSE